MHLWPGLLLRNLKEAAMSQKSYYLVSIPGTSNLTHVPSQQPRIFGIYTVL